MKVVYGHTTEEDHIVAVLSWFYGIGPIEVQSLEFTSPEVDMAIDYWEKQESIGRFEKYDDWDGDHFNWWKTEYKKNGILWP